MPPIGFWILCKSGCKMKWDNEKTLRGFILFISMLCKTWKSPTEDGKSMQIAYLNAFSEILLLRLGIRQRRDVLWFSQGKMRQDRKRGRNQQNWEKQMARVVLTIFLSSRSAGCRLLELEPKRNFLSVVLIFVICDCIKNWKLRFCIVIVTLIKYWIYQAVQKLIFMNMNQYQDVMQRDGYISPNNPLRLFPTEVSYLIANNWYYLTVLIVFKHE